jgi:hypothetical protein
VQITGVARSRGQFWAYAATQRRAGPPASWPPFNGTLESARARVASMARGYNDEAITTLAEACLDEARRYFEELRADDALRRKWGGR